MQLRTGSDATELQPQSGAVELNLFALSLVGLDSSNRAATMDAVAEIEGGFVERLAATLGMLAERGTLAAIPDWADSAPLQEPTGAPGLHHAAMLFAGERAVMTRQLLSDLEEMAGLSPADLLTSAPLACLLGYLDPPTPPPPRPQPTILPSNLSQDRAITASLTSALTVVTGPPGTGKSQVLVNAVAAALARGESVLFASRNNQAVDVVFHRLAEVSSEAVPLRVGAAALRNNTAAQIRSALSRSRSSEPSVVEARRAWDGVATRLDGLYGQEATRLGLEARIEASESRFRELTAKLPSALVSLTGPRGVEMLVAAFEKAHWRVGTRVRSPFFRGRKRRQRERAAQDAWAALLAALPRGSSDTLGDTPPSDPHGVISDIRAACIGAKQEEVTNALRAELAGVPNRWTTQEAIRGLDSARTASSRQLFDADWVACVRNAAAGIRSDASTYADAIESLSAGRGRPSVRKVVRSVLTMFPVWGVTSLSARTNFELDRGLFDLLIVDEASQCDIASALPLLYRARRAMIIGDNKQLTHISSLTQAQI